MSGDAEPKVAEYHLKEDEELRFEVAAGEVVLELCEGKAEIFGTELVQHRRYTFSTGTRVAVFSWHGAVVELVGTTEGAYVASQTPMAIYVNTHAGLEQMRSLAERGGHRGPIMMVVGPTDVGKSTLCKLLLNYAARLGRCPIYVDLDVGQGSISIPGTIGALHIERPADPVEGFEKKFPLVYEFGHLSPAENIRLYNHVVAKLAEVVRAKLAVSQVANGGGVIINTCGWVKGAGYTCVVEAARSFEVDVIVVLDHERLYNDLLNDMPTLVKIIHQPKSGGVEDRSRELRIAARRSKIRQYFYGTVRNPLYPHSFDIRFSDVQIFKIGAPNLPESCMPLGMRADDNSTKLVHVTPSLILAHHILAISLCESPSDDVVGTNVAGFLCVTEVHMDKACMTVLCPQPLPLPRSILILSEITFMDMN